MTEELETLRSQIDALDRQIVELLEARPGEWDLSSLLLLGSGGSMLSADVKVRLLDATLLRFARARIPVILISGNHDSAVRLGFGGTLVDGVWGSLWKDWTITADLTTGSGRPHRSIDCEPARRRAGATSTRSA